MLSALRAGGERVILHTLFDLKPIRADFTLVLVDWHVLFPPSRTEISCYTQMCPSHKKDVTLGKLSECRVEAVHSPDNGLHTGCIRESNVLGASKWFTGNHRNLGFLQQVVRKVGGSGDSPAWALPSEQATHIGERIKCPGGHSAANARHRIQAFDHDAPSPIEFYDHLFRKRTTVAQGDDGSLL